MRKVIAGLIMVCAIGFYVVHLLNVGETDEKSSPTQNNEVTKETEVAKALEGYEKQLTNNYPEAPADIMNIYDALLEIAYGGKISEEELSQYVKVVRMMYSKGFNELNPEEKQLSGLLQELKQNKEKGVNIVASKVGQVYILKNEKGEETEATVTVAHATNTSSDERQYIFIKEDGVWKINGWQSTHKNITEE